MSRPPLPKPSGKLSRFARRFRYATAGVAAIEFAFLMPILVLMLVGTVEASRAISLNRKFSLVTSMTGDLVAREKDLGSNPSATLASIMGVIDHVIAPYDPTKLKLAVIPVMASPTDETQTFVYATPYSHNGKSVPAKCAPYPLPPGLVGKGGSVIVIESEYEFDPMIVDGIAVETVWEDKATHSPRHAFVKFDPNENPPGQSCL